MLEFYCFLLTLRRYLRDGKKNPIPLRPYIHQLAAQLPVEESLTDRGLLDALRVYAIDNWWPESWGEPPIDRWLFIHNGQYLNLEAEALLERLVEQHNLDLESLPCDDLDGLLANDVFNQIRLELVRKWAENPDDRDAIEAAYRELRLLLAQNVVIDKYELQRRLLAGNLHLDLRTVRSGFYVVATDMKHMSDGEGNFTTCSRCGLRNPNEMTCIRPRCPGEAGWQYHASKPNLMLLHPEHIVRIVLPAIEELALYERIKAIIEPTEGSVVLWPAVDRFDIYVTTPTMRIAIDVKDWQQPEQLANSINSDIPNYAPYPYDLGVYVYPAERGGKYGQIVRERTGSRLSTNRIMSTSSILDKVKKAVK